MLDAFKKRGRFDVPRNPSETSTELNAQEKKCCQDKNYHASHSDIVSLSYCWIAWLVYFMFHSFQPSKFFPFKAFFWYIRKILQVSTELCKSCCSNRLDEHGNLVKNLVGSFEAIGKTVESSLSVTRALDLSQPKLRLGKVTDWKSRRGLAVSVPPACSNSPIRQARAVTISQ